mmetsp:Transcript_25930/g.39738  ORF Transcript_25930/g.39738 Transcript_25930/m.39738 type:complete len:122 (+) Transcript_25930:92-457(+)
MPSTSEVFAAMGAAVEGAGGKAIQRKFKGQVVFRITDTDEVYSLDLKGPVFSVEKGDKNMTSPDLTVIITSENMAALISGALKPQQAFMKGKLKIKGKMNLAMKLNAVLVATRKKLPKPKM